MQQVDTRKRVNGKIARLHQFECCFAGGGIGVAASSDDQPLSEPVALGKGAEIARQYVFTQFWQLHRVRTVETA